MSSASPTSAAAPTPAMPAPALAAGDSDVQIGGDLLSVPHLLQPAKEHPETVAEFVGLARSLAADRGQWEHLVAYDATSRWYHRLRTGPGYEVWLLSWVPGQGSGPHDHGASSGVLTVLAGELTERSQGGVRVLGEGAQRVLAPGYAHEVVNDSLEPAVSLHVYYPGLTEMPVREAGEVAGAGAVAEAGVGTVAGAGAPHGRDVVPA